MTTGSQTLPPRDSASQPVPPGAKKDLSVKQQRDERRAVKVAVLKKQQVKEKRNRIVGFSLAGLGTAAVLALVVVTVVTSGTPAVDRADISIEGLETFDGLAANHVGTTVDYAQSPPVGGDHAGAWLNCGVYTEVIPNENAVHSLEHGAVWITYNPDEVTGADLDALYDEVPSTYSLVSPFPDLQAPVVISAWGSQLELTGIGDPRLQQFVDKFWQDPNGPEPGSACTGAIDGPGKIA
ncbi:MAG: DUF3105 domain-containing protein [Burkholderiaceae bacterium]|nr:DUF3105 domain-containing protein [Microbacteriaceae bacterium]